jgi:hypothetical protein
VEADRDLIDADGRPIGELASRVYDRIETEVVACPYRDVRRGLPMNHTALRQLSSCWDEVLAATSALAGAGATVHRAWWATIAGTTAPRIHAERFGTPIPRTLSALYKGSLGFSQVLTAMLMSTDGLADEPLTSLGAPEEFLALLDDGRWLVGQVQVCAGPGPMIAQMVEALGGSDPETPPPCLTDLGEATAWAGPAVTWVGLQAAFLGAAGTWLREHGGDPGDVNRYLDPTQPWLRGVVQAPDRRPEHARRLFESGGVPDAVEAFLAAGTAPCAELRERLESLRPG